jgi:hypothetical protein
MWPANYAGGTRRTSVYKHRCYVYRNGTSDRARLYLEIER